MKEKFFKALLSILLVLLGLITLAGMILVAFDIVPIWLFALSGILMIIPIMILFGWELSVTEKEIDFKINLLREFIKEQNWENDNDQTKTN